MYVIAVARTAGSGTLRWTAEYRLPDRRLATFHLETTAAGRPLAVQPVDGHPEPPEAGVRWLAGLARDECARYWGRKALDSVISARRGRNRRVEEEPTSA